MHLEVLIIVFQWKNSGFYDKAGLIYNSKTSMDSISTDESWMEKY